MNTMMLQDPRASIGRVGGNEFERELACAARSDVPLLIAGVDDAEDRAVAEAIHRRSSRAIAPFLSVNCARPSEFALELQMFGLGSGAGGDDARGALERAHGGTIFLANIDRLSARLQAALLRFVGTGEIHRIGEACAHRKVDVRVVASATDRLSGRGPEIGLHEDLFYRLNVILLVVPVHRLDGFQGHGSCVSLAAGCPISDRVERGVPERANRIGF
jgi:DNA-binding NtrC family response regulator